MKADTVTITVDGVEIQARAEQTIMQAADDAGMYIPRLCYHKDLPPGGHCRVCTVRVNGRPVNACTYPVTEGLIIENDTEDLNLLRRNIVEMMFVEGNHYCPSCEASGNCELQALAYRLGLLAPQYPYLNSVRELDASHPDVYLDRNRCVLCGRCVRASAHLDQKNVFGFEGRGAKKRIAVNAAGGLGETDMTSKDRAARICPTGCLVVKREAYAKPVGQRQYDHNVIGADIETKRVAQ